MLPYSACKEVLDGIVLFAGQQRQGSPPLSSSSTQGQSLILTISSEGDTVDVYWSARVDVGGLGIYYLNEEVFVNKLYSSCARLHQIARNKEGEGEDVMTVYSRRMGEYSTVQKHTIIMTSRSDSSSKMSVQNSVLPRPSDFPPYGLRVSFQLIKSRIEVMRKEVDKLLSYMQLLHLSNSFMMMEMTVRDSSGVLITKQFPREHVVQLKQSPSSYSTLTLSLHHFMSVQTSQTRLKLVRGISYSLAGLKHGSGRELSLRVLSSSSIAPHLSLPRGKKIPANRVCQDLQVYVYGPGGVPMARSGSLSLVSLSNLAHWENYGLSLSPASQDTNDTGEKSASEVCSGCCRMSDTRRSVESDGTQRAGYNLTLLLFIHLEAVEEDEEEERREREWSKMVDMVSWLREKMESLILNQKRKFQQATHSALNKLLCNYETHNKKSSSVRNALPQLADAVSSIIRHSTNQGFKERCQAILKTRGGEGERTERDVIAEKLWVMAGNKVHVHRNTTKHPQEPSSPELDRAVSNSQELEVEQRIPTTHRVVVGLAATESVTGPTDPTLSTADLPTTTLDPTLPSELTQEQPTNISSQLQTKDRGNRFHGQENYSIFRPTFISRNGSPSAKGGTRGVEVVDEGESSFEALADIEGSPDWTAQHNDKDTSTLASTNCVTYEYQDPVRTDSDKGTYFEELATAIADEEENFSFSQGPLRNRVNEEEEERSGEMFDYSDGNEEELMDWGEEEFPEEEEEEDEECWFSDFSNSECNAERLRPGIKETVTETIGSLKTENSTELTDSDWDTLGEMANISPAVYQPLTPAKTSAETSPLPSQTLHNTVPIVPDTSSNIDHLFPADIDEKDFHWD